MQDTSRRNSGVNDVDELLTGIYNASVALVLQQ